MKKRILILITLLFIILFLIVAVFISVAQDSDVYELHETDRLNLCKSNNCQYLNTMIFADMEYNDDIAVIKETVDKINKDTNKYYKQVINSSFDDKACKKVENKFNYSKGVFSDYNSYTNEDYITFAVKRTLINVCTDEVTDLQVESYVYDRKTNKMLTQEEFKSKFYFMDEKIKVAISMSNQSLDEDDQMDSLDSAINDAVLYYDTVGNLFVSYYNPIKQVYYTGTINE